MEINLEFFEGLESNDAFSFMIDENTDFFIPVKETNYHLFESNIYPFVVYADELRSLNQYCYQTAQSVKWYVKDAVENLQGCDMIDQQMDQLYLCERIIWHSSSHMVTLLYSFLERSLKVFWTDMFCKDKSSSNFTKSKVKLYAFMEKIFNLSVEEFGEQYPDIFQMLDCVRIYRNKVIHGQFMNNEANDIYEEVWELPSFRMFEVLEMVSDILDLVVLKYSALEETKS